MATFSPLLDVLANVSDPRRAQGQLYPLPYVLMVSILAIMTGCNSYRGIVTFIDLHRRGLNAAFGLNQCRAPPSAKFPMTKHSGKVRVVGPFPTVVTPAAT